MPVFPEQLGDLAARRTVSLYSTFFLGGGRANFGVTYLLRARWCLSGFVANFAGKEVEDEEEKEGRRGELNFSPPFEQGGGRRRRRRKRPWADLAVGTRRRRRAHEKGEVKKVILPLACASS